MPASELERFAYTESPPESTLAVHDPNKCARRLVQSFGLPVGLWSSDEHAVIYQPML